MCPLERVITYTSRPARSTDASGVDYNFVSAQEFQERIKQNFFLEWSTAYGNYYGTPRTLIEKVDSGASYIAVVDRAGVQSILNVYSRAVAIWLEPPSFSELEQRLRGRATESVAELEKRLALAQREIEQERIERLCKYCVINRELDVALIQLKEIILKELSLPATQAQRQ